MAEDLESGAAEEAERQLESQADEMLSALDRVVAALTSVDIPHLFLGGVASAVLGRYRHTADIDVLVHPSRARDALEALSEAGFETEETFPHWLFKARTDAIVVDVLFASTGGIYLDPEMLEHAVVGTFRDRALPLVGPEDMIVMKALAHQEETPRHWFDALGILGRSEIDWAYLVDRARRGPRRVLSLLAYAQSSDLSVPDEVLKELFELLEPTRSP